MIDDEKIEKQNSKNIAVGIPCGELGEALVKATYRKTKRRSIDYLS